MNSKQETLAKGRAVMATTSFITQQVCQPGVLTFNARGTAADKLLPLMSISVNDQPLLTARVGAERLYRVQVLEAGLLTITFHDDAYRPNAVPPEDRNLFVNSVRFVPTPPSP